MDKIKEIKDKIDGALLKELIIEDEQHEVFAISFVKNPAIEEDFLYLSEDNNQGKIVDKEERIVMGAALIPDLPILRLDEQGEKFYVYFSQETVKELSRKYLINHYQSNSTLEHAVDVDDITLVESWIVDDPKQDKSAKYGLNVPEGTWMVTMKVDNDEVWEDFVKNGKVKGFSIEGKFADRVQLKEQEQEEELLEAINEMLLNELKELLSDIELETYNDYPESAKNNAKKVLEWRDKYGDEVKGMTRVGWTRANQLAKGENISQSTIARMASFKRHEKNAEVSAENKSTPWKDAGRVAWLGWGGSSGVNWAINKMKTFK